MYRACFMFAVLLTGCFGTTRYTDVRLRDPADVTVSADTPHGREVVLPAGPAPNESVVPKSVPPYYGGTRLPISARREETGETLLRCDTCDQYEATEVVAPTGQAVLDPDDGNSVRRNHDQLLWDVTQSLVRYHVGYRGRLHEYDDPVARVVVSTPMSNVVSADHVSRGSDKVVGIFEIALAIPLVIGGGYLFAQGTVPQKNDQAFLAGGAALATLGVLIGASGIVLAMPERRTPVVDMQ
jgi:hypothetical protein